MNIKRIVIWIAILVPILAFVGFAIWSYTPLGPMPEAVEAMNSTSDVTVEENAWFLFSPVNAARNAGLIIYPGGRVDPRSYAPTAMQFAEDGFFSVIVPMPFNLAVFGAARAGEVIKKYPEIDNWVVAGHSLGGTMAANYAYQNPDDVDGLVLWAAYPAAGDDLSISNLASASIFGTNDGLVSDQDIQNSIQLLPDDNLLSIIEGGNHAQFGWYGDQAGDNPPTITRQEQQNMVIEATLEIMREVDLLPEQN